MDIDLSCVWTIKRKRWYPISSRLVWEEVLTRKNVFTNYGLTALASALSGTYIAPNYLILENATVTLANAYSIGATSIVLNSRIDQAGDTQLVLAPGSVNQETVTFSSVTSVAPFTYTLTAATVNTHSVNELVVRNVVVTDVMTSIISEVAYDSVNAPGQRLGSTAGYSSGTGSWTIQFYLPAGTATSYISGIALSDSNIIGQGNLHNHVILGYDNTSGANDLEIDGNLTLINA